MFSLLLVRTNFLTTVALLLWRNGVDSSTPDFGESVQPDFRDSFTVVTVVE
jgi:hypothetical protein